MNSYNLELFASRGWLAVIPSEIITVISAKKKLKHALQNEL